MLIIKFKMAWYHGVAYVDGPNIKATGTGICVKWTAGDKMTIKASKQILRDQEDQALAAALNVTVPIIKQWRKSMDQAHNVPMGVGGATANVNGKLKGCSCAWNGSPL